MFKLDDLTGKKKTVKKVKYVFVRRVRKFSRFYNFYKELAESLTGPVLEYDMSGNFPAPPSAKLITLWGRENLPKNSGSRKSSLTKRLAA